MIENAVARIFTISKQETALFQKNAIWSSGGHAISPLEILDFSDKETYRRAVWFASATINNALRRKYIFRFVWSEDELVSETILSIADSDSSLDNLTGDFFIKTLYRTLRKMYNGWVKENPRVEDWLKQYYKNQKIRNRALLRTPYIKAVIKGVQKYHNKWNEEIGHEELMKMVKEKRERIKLLREKRGYVAMDYD